MKIDSCKTILAQEQQWMWNIAFTLSTPCRHIHYYSHIFVFLSSPAAPVFYFYVILSHSWIDSMTYYLSARQK